MKKLFSIQSVGLALSIFSSVGASLAQDSPIIPATPEHILPKGVDTTLVVNPYTEETGEIRKGTVAATINNIAALNKLLQEDDSHDARKNAEQIANEICNLLPSLRIGGMFDIFNPLEWVSTTSQPGRILTAILYMDKFSEQLTPEIKRKLENIKDTSLSNYLSEQIDRLLKKNKMAN